MRTKKIYGKPQPNKNERRVNQSIRSDKILLIGADGTKLGMTNFRDAFAQAEAAGLDLVELSVEKENSVCKIMDYGKYKYQQSKKSHKSRAKQKNVDTKEIKVHLSTGDNDLNTKINNAKRFLTGGDKLKLVVKLRGREKGRRDMAAEKIAYFMKQIEDCGKVEKDPAPEGGNLVAFFVPSNYAVKENLPKKKPASDHSRD